MENVLNIAKSFLTFESMSHKKIQKLCYYAYSWYLTLTNQELFKEGFEAWVHGPVNRELYSHYADYGWSEIGKIDKNVEEILTEGENKKLIEEIYRIYGHLNGDELEALTHEERPWIDARKGLNAWESSKEKIDNEIIKEFFRNQLES